jgi:hypothetical protein
MILRKFIPLLILSLGVVGAFWVGHDDKSPKNANDSLAQALVISDGKSDARFDFSRNTSPSTLPKSVEETASLSISHNATDRTLNAYGKEIVRLNSNRLDAVQLGGSVILPDEENLSKILSDNITNGFSSPSFDIDDIIIIPDSADAIQQYGISVSEAYEKNSTRINSHFITAIYETLFMGRSSELAIYTVSFSGMLDDFLKISVPSRFTAIHIELLNIVQKKISISNALINIDDDPVRAVGGLEQLEGVVADEARLIDTLNRFST